MKSWHRNLTAAVMGVALAASIPFGVYAKTLNVGVLRATPSTDPHYSSTIPIYEEMINVFEPAVRFDANNKVVPWLVESWRLINDTTWEFKVRPNVKWHDGAPLTAADIAFTYERARNVPNSPAPLTNYLRPIIKTEIVDDLTLRLHTEGPSPTLLQLLVSVMIVSKKHGEGTTTEDYHNGRGMVGTGPYTFVSWKANDRVEIKKNPNYWGEAPLWDGVNFVGMSNDASRIAALLAGDIDVAMGVPAQEVARLRKDSRVNIYDRPANRHVFLAFDVNPEALENGKLTGPNGEKLDKNPLADARVREALKLAIQSDAVVERVYLGLAKASGQYLLDGMFGYLNDVPLWKPDEARAKKLLEESGWANKFKIVLGTSDTAFRGSSASIQALAQFWTRIGVPTEATIMPHPVFLEQRNSRKLPVVLAAWTNPAGSAEDLYMPILHARDTGRGFGTLNMVRYVNPNVDKLIEQGMVTMDTDKRRAIFEEAGRTAIKEAVVVPLWNPSETFATRKGLRYISRADGLLMVDHVKPE